MDRSDPQRARPGNKADADAEAQKPSGEQHHSKATSDETAAVQDPARFGETEADAAERAYFDHLERDTTQPVRRYAGVPLFDQQTRPAPLNRDAAAHQPADPEPPQAPVTPDPEPQPEPEPYSEPDVPPISRTFEPQPFAVPRPSDRPLPQVPRRTEPSPPAQPPSKPASVAPAQAAPAPASPVEPRSASAAPETERQVEASIAAKQTDPPNEPPVEPAAQEQASPEPASPSIPDASASRGTVGAEPEREPQPRPDAALRPESKSESPPPIASEPIPAAPAAEMVRESAPPPLPTQMQVPQQPSPLAPRPNVAPPPLPPRPVAAPPPFARGSQLPPRPPVPPMPASPPALPGDQSRWSEPPRPQPPPAARPSAPPPPPVPRPDPSFDFAVRPVSAVDAEAPPVSVAPGRRDWRDLARRAAHALFLVFAGWFIAVLVLIVAYRFVNPPISMLMVQRFLTGNSINKQWVPIERISPNLQRAVIVSEDGRFCQHWGVDFIEAANALRRASDGYPRGASTITMQVAKNLFLLPTKSYLRKAVEIPLTFAIELAWSKRRILEVYLNIVEWGPGVFGAEAASRAHFGRSAASLSPRQAAQLAAVLPNPIVRDAGSPGPRTARKASVIQSRAARGRSASACVDIQR